VLKLCKFACHRQPAGFWYRSSSQFVSHPVRRQNHCAACKLFHPLKLTFEKTTAAFTPEPTATLAKPTGRCLVGSLRKNCRLRPHHLVTISRGAGYSSNITEHAFVQLFFLLATLGSTLASGWKLHLTPGSLDT
jgi:hypothetical protein